MAVEASEEVGRIGVGERERVDSDEIVGNPTTGFNVEM
jgi:hypothetical protein